MTHKENIKAILEVHFAGFKDELIESAVNRIMQLKYEKSHDCLDREYLFQVLDDFCEPDRGATITLDILADLVADMPSVQPEQKTGHWIEHEHDGIVHIECSKCSTWFLRAHLLRNSYCPNCGAKMEGGEKSDN